MVQGHMRATVLFLGDILVFSVSLFLTLLLRYQGSASATLVYEHIASFSMLFMVWVLVFYIVGLYSKSAVLLKSRWPQLLLRAQVFNIVIAALFFFVVPFVSIEPKTSLLLYLVISVLLSFVWRLFVYPNFGFTMRRTATLLVGDGDDVEQLYKEICSHQHYPFNFIERLSTNDIHCVSKQWLEERGVQTIIADMSVAQVQEHLTTLYTSVESPLTLPVYSFTDVYEEVFDRVALSRVNYYELLRRAQGTPLYFKLLKRAIDTVGGLVLLIICALTLPFVYLANRLEGTQGGLFIVQQRFGAKGKMIKVLKLRTMTNNDSSSQNWIGEKQENRITKVGDFLRKTSLDEFPQAFNLIKGELSLIGPRTDIAGLGERLRKELVHYDMRYVITPGITGWAQITQVYDKGNLSPQSLSETRERLAYDFYYIKKRSLALDIVIAIKTFKRIFTRTA